MAEIERVIEGLESIKQLGASGSPAHIKIDETIQTIRELQEQIPKWHYVADGELPKEHDSMFAKFKGTDKWNNAMFEKISDDVIVAIKDENGRCVTTNAHTTDGKWKCDLLRAFSVYEVIAWTELPKFEGVE